MVGLSTQHQSSQNHVKLFLCGDVMTGRGIDQLLPTPSSPELHEPYVADARDYVRLAEQRLGRKLASLTTSSLWGDALAVLNREKPDKRIVNLETAITTSDYYWPNKGIHYRMHPANAHCLQALGVDCCVLGNNHVLDWNYQGLTDTLNTLDRLNINHCGAGDSLAAASAPAVLTLPSTTESPRRVLVFSIAFTSSGVPPSWAATGERAGVFLLPDYSSNSVRMMQLLIARHRKTTDIVVVSIHWRGNWGYRIDRDTRAFAHGLIDNAGVDLIHGHSSHHPIGMESYRGHLILYGCGDFINDYEGISGHEVFRPQLSLMYLVQMNVENGTSNNWTIIPMHVDQFRLRHAGHNDTRWLASTLNRYSRDFNIAVSVNKTGPHPTLTVSTLGNDNGE